MTATNPGMFDRREYYKEKGVYYELRATTLQITSFRTNPVKDLLYRLRNRMGEVYTTSLPAKESGIVSAMILGDKSLLDIDIRQLYQESGIGHLLAISGVKTRNLGIPLIPKDRINTAFLSIHIAKIYIQKVYLDEDILPRCRFPCSRG